MHNQGAVSCAHTLQQESYCTKAFGGQGMHMHACAVSAIGHAPGSEVYAVGKAINA